MPLTNTLLSPASLHKSNSCSDVANSLTRSVSVSSSTNNTSCDKSPSAYKLIKETLFLEIKQALPLLIQNALKVELKPFITRQNELQQEISNLKSKVSGYKAQVEKWTQLVNTHEEEVIPALCDQINKLDKDWKAKEKSIATKTKNQVSIQNKIKNDLNEISNLKNEWEILLKAKCNNTDELINGIEKSQEFVSAEYTDFKKKQDEMEKEMKELQKAVKHQGRKAEHACNYSRWDCLDLAGVPYVPIDEEGNENCREMVINICKELHYWVPASTISTAHRLKQHPSKTGPAPIIVKFNNRDVRDDVFRLRNQCKDKTYWRCYNIRKLFINESLTPETRRLFRQTRIFARELERTHGRIFTWTFKGEIYIRKKVENGPKIKISCESDISDIRNGHISLDPDIQKCNVESSTFVCYDDIMAGQLPAYSS